MTPPEVPYRAPKEHNPFWPLPPQYGELGPEMRRHYRRAVCCTQDTPDDFVTAFLFFQAYYLFEGRENGFFFDNYAPDAPFHLEGLRDFVRHDFNVFAAPRGFAKSVKWGLQLPLLLLLTRPYYKVAICMATDSLLEKRISAIRKQLRRNKELIEDWGQQRPIRGEGLWTLHNLEFENGSMLEGFSVTGRKRGGRPHMFILDDPEYDPEKSTDVRALTSGLDALINRQIIPMLAPGCKLFWLGTTINRRTLLYHALQGDDDRFAQWNRRRLKSFERRPDGTVLLLWPGSEWTYDALMLRRRLIGASAFAAEYQNEPVADEDRLFHIHPVYDTYEVEGALDPSPFQNQAVIRYVEIPRTMAPDAATDVKRVEMPFAEFMKKMPNIIMCFDYGETISATSDYSTISILGFTSDLNMWLLDFWAGKVTDNALVVQLWRMGSLWRPRLVTSDTKNKSVMNLLTFRTADLAIAEGDTGWRPRCFDIKNAGRSAPSKAQRIAGDEWRFTAHRIKLPLYRRNEPMWVMAFDQIEDFTMDLNLLEHDDAVDVILGMARYVIRTTKSQQAVVLDQTKTPEDYLKEGRLQDDDGFPIYASPEDAPQEHVEAGLDILRARGYNRRDRRHRRRTQSRRFGLRRVTQ